MNNQNNQKISHMFNLPNLNFKTQMNLTIDANAHIKSIISVQAYTFDTTTDAVAGKCNVKGKIGVRIIYLDTDNVYNTLTDETSFSEFVTSSDVTADCKVILFNEQVSSEIDFDEKYLKINLTVNAKLVSNVDLSLNLIDTSADGLIVKNEQKETQCCIEKIDNKTLEECKLTLPSRASKILAVNIVPSIERTECNSGYITVAGNSLIQIIYETDNNSFTDLKLFTENCPFKFETQATLSEPDCLPNIGLKTNNSKTSFSTELDENQTIINLSYELLINGFVYKTINLELVKDVYSISNEIETDYSSREFCSLTPLVTYKSNIEGEVQLQDNSIDEIIETVNHSCLITQSYIENNKMVLEGLTSSTVIYLTEDKEIKSMIVELPFSISKDYENNNNCEMLNFDIKPLVCKAKIKRGNSLSLDYECVVEGCCINKCETKMLQNIKFGKIFDYGDIAFQIIVAKPNENVWELCKRTHITLEKLEEYNKEIPPVFQGGEKILIYR